MHHFLITVMYFTLRRQRFPLSAFSRWPQDMSGWSVWVFHDILNHLGPTLVGWTVDLFVVSKMSVSCPVVLILWYATFSNFPFTEKRLIDSFSRTQSCYTSGEKGGLHFKGKREGEREGGKIAFWENSKRASILCSFHRPSQLIPVRGHRQPAMVNPVIKLL